MLTRILVFILALGLASPVFAGNLKGPGAGDKSPPSRPHTRGPNNQP